MENENYKFDIPLDHSQSLEVSIKLIDKHSEIDKDSIQLKPVSSGDQTEKAEVKISRQKELTKNIKKELKSTRLPFYNGETLQQSLMASTSAGFQLLRLNQIIYFEYITEKKLWAVVLFDQSHLLLKRNTNAETILGYSPSFVRINQQFIINLNYLVRIEGRTCLLSISSKKENRFIISRKYLKGLQVRVEVI